METDRSSRPRRTSTTRTFFDPSPSAASASRFRQPPASTPNPNSHYHSRIPSSHSSQEPHGGSLQEISESESEGEGGGQEREMSKLELRRAKNRLKQRNLRHRRATHVSQLEESVRALKRDLGSIRDHTTLQTTVVTSNEIKYRSWLGDLEGVLFRQGLGGEVERMRQIWERSIQAIPTWTSPSTRSKAVRKPKGSVSVKQEPRDMEIEVERMGGRRISSQPSSSRGSISTLVQAAMVSDSTHMSTASHQHPSTPGQSNIYPSYGHQSTPIMASRPQSQSGTGARYSDQIGSSQPQPRSLSKPLTVYPGSLQALSNPPSLPRHHYRSRTIPTSTSSSHPSSSTPFSSLYPEAPEDRKRKRSLSGPTLHSFRIPTNELPPIMSLSAPSSGLVVPQSQPSGFSYSVPPLPVAMTRPSSSHSHQPVPGPSSMSASRTGWNTLAPFRPQTAPNSRPTTPSAGPTPSGPFAQGLETSPRHMRIENLITSKPEDRA